MSCEKPQSRTEIVVANRAHLTPHTAYYNNFFLLRIPVTVNGQPAQVGWSSGEELTLSCRYPNLSLPLHSIRAFLQEVVKNHGVSQVGDVCCEQVPLFVPFLLLLLSSHTPLNTSIWSAQFLFPRNPPCASVRILSSANSPSLLVKHLVNTFATQLPSAIPL